jgi:hypothetical protein
MFLIILIKSLIIGGLVGVGVGAERHACHAPTQGMGAFRTLGELNSCEGDPASHFSFGLGFFQRLGLFRRGRLLHSGR